jgi:DNA-binding SARP family transcriptional activator
MGPPTDLDCRPTYLLLGPAGVRQGASTRLVSGRRQNILFASLALRPHSPIDTRELLDSLWEAEPPSDPGGALQSQVSRLRSFLGGQQVAYANGAYVLRVAAGAIDVFAFEDLLREARQLLDGHALVLARRRVEEGLALWRGRPFPELADVDFAESAAERLDELRLEGLVVRVQADLALGRTAQAVISLRSLTAAYPLREDLWAMLIRGLYVAGRPGDALAAFRAARAALVRELGLEPGPELQALEAAMLRRDPALAALPHRCDEHGRRLAATPRPLARLPVPGPDLARELAGDWQRGGSAQAFLDRVRATQPGYEPQPVEAADILRLCRLLGGDPVELERAAAQLPHQSVRELVRQHEECHESEEVGGPGILDRSSAVARHVGPSH